MTSKYGMERMQRAILVKSETWIRAEAMGFEFLPPHLEDGGQRGGPVVFGGFRCPCGKSETYRVDFDPLPDVIFETDTVIADHVGAIAREGSFSREHLLADGHTEAEVDAMEARAAIACGVTTP